MALSRFVLPFADVGSGISPSSGAKLFFYATGTSTLATTFSDSAGSTPNANPVIAGANGVFPSIFLSGIFKVRLTDKNDVQKWEADPVSSQSLGIVFEGLSEVTEGISIAPANYPVNSGVNTLSYRTKAECTALSIPYPDGGGADYIIVASGTGTADGLSFIDIDSSIQLKFNNKGKILLKQSGCVSSATINNTDRLQACINYASESSTGLFDDGGSYIYTTLEWKSNVYLEGLSFESSKLVLSGSASPSIFSSSPITNFGIDNFNVDGTFMLKKSFGSGVNSSIFGNFVPCENVNSYFHTWRRTDARDQTVFSAVAPTFGAVNTYDGTGGLKVYHADAWYVKMFGNQGTGTITQVVNNGVEREISKSDYHANYVTTAVVPPPLKFNLTVTNATSFNTTTITITVGAHSINVNDYIWWDGATYNGGNGGVETTFQITGTTSTTLTFTITQDAGFTSWINFGRITDDPDNTGREHIHDPVLGTIRRSWIRNGTSGQETYCRVPTSRLGGFVTVRVKMRYNSGDAGWFIRIFQNFGSGGSGNTSTTLPGFMLDTTTSEIQEVLIYAQLPEIASKTFGEGSFSQIGLTGSIFEQQSNVDIFEISVFGGLNLPVDSDSSYMKEKPMFQKLYNANRISFLAPIENGRFYAVAPIYSEQMYGAPVVTQISETITTGMAVSTVANGSKFGYNLELRANATQNVGEYLALYQSEYVIPSDFVGN